MEEDINALIRLLDQYNESGGSRMKIEVISDANEKGIIEKKYHHGRCDVCSPFATGQAFDVIE